MEKQTPAAAPARRTEVAAGAQPHAGGGAVPIPSGAGARTRLDVLLYRRRLRVAAIAVVLRRGGPMSVGEILDALRAAGHQVDAADRPARVLADALALEARKGRLRRVRRGWYGPGTIPATTRWRILHWEELHGVHGWARDFTDLQRRTR